MSACSLFFAISVSPLLNGRSAIQMGLRLSLWAPHPFVCFALEHYGHPYVSLTVRLAYCRGGRVIVTVTPLNFIQKLELWRFYGRCLWFSVASLELGSNAVKSHSSTCCPSLCKRVDAVNVSVTCHYIISRLSSTRSMGLLLMRLPDGTWIADPGEEIAHSHYCVPLFHLAPWSELGIEAVSVSLMFICAEGGKMGNSVVHGPFCLLFLGAGRSEVVAICSLYNN